MMDHSIIGGDSIVEEWTLSNGLTVWLSVDQSAPKVHGSVVVKAGAKDSPNTGIAHYFEHIMFKGTKSIGTVDYDNEAPILDRISKQYAKLKFAQNDAERTAVQMEINRLNKEAAQYAVPNDFNNLISKYGGSNLNAGTSFDYTIFYNVFTPNFIEHWCELNSERLIDPVFRLFQSELETVYEEKNMYADNMMTEPMQRIFDKIASPHPYRFPIIGATEALKSPDLHEMERFFDTYYRAGNMALILVGNFKHEGLKELLERTFGKIKPGTVDRSSILIPRPQPFDGHERLDIKVPVPAIKGSGYIWHTVPNGDPDQVYLTLIQGLLTNEGKTGFLDQLILNGSVMETAATNMALNDMGIFGFYVIPKPLRSNGIARKKVLKEIQRIKEGDFSERQLEEVKLTIRKNYIAQIEDTEKRSKLLGNLYAQGDKWSDFVQDLATLQSATVQDIVEIANKYLTDDFLDIRKKTGRYPKDKISKPPYEPVTAPKQGATSKFARYLETLEVTPVPIKFLDFQNDVERCTLSTNGLARLYKVNNSLNDLFSLDLLFFRQYTKHPIQEYFDNYLDLVGGAGRSANQFNEELQRLGGSIKYQCKESFFVVQVSGFDRNFAAILSLVGDFLSSVNVEEKQMKKLRDIKKVADKALRKDTAALSKNLLDLARYGSAAPYKLSPTLDQLKKTTARGVVDEIHRLLSHEMDAHYTGTLPIDEVAQILYESLSIDKISTPGEGYYYESPLEYSKPTLYFANDNSATQAIIRGYLTVGVLDQRQRILFRLYAAYMGGGMSSLLFQEIREYRSLAYGVTGYANLTPASIPDGNNDFVVFLSTQADKVIDAIVVLRELLQRSPDTESRFKAAIETMRSTISTYYPPLRMKSRTIASLERQGYEQDISTILLEALEGLTITDLIDFYNEIIKDQSMTLTIVGDKSKINMVELSKHFDLKEIEVNQLIR